MELNQLDRDAWAGASAAFQAAVLVEMAACYNRAMHTRSEPDRINPFD